MERIVAESHAGSTQEMDGLAAFVNEHVRTDPYRGIVQMFRAKRGDRMQLPAAHRGRHERAGEQAGLRQGFGGHPEL